MKKYLKDSRGFTLIELLVVVSIISVLSSIVLASLNSARAKARDVVVLQEVNEITKALHLSLSDSSVNTFPDPGTGVFCLGLTESETCWLNFHGNTSINNFLLPNLPNIPKPPKGLEAFMYTYRPSSDAFQKGAYIIYTTEEESLRCNGVYMGCLTINHHSGCYCFNFIGE